MTNESNALPLPLLWALCQPLAEARTPAGVLDAAARAFAAQGEFDGACAHLFELSRPRGSLVAAHGLSDAQADWAIQLECPRRLVELTSLHGGPYPLRDLALLDSGEAPTWPGAETALCIPLFGLDQVFAHITLFPVEGVDLGLEQNWHLYAIAGHLVCSSLGRELNARGLSDQVQFLQFVIDLIPCPVYFRGADGSYTGCNAEFAQLVGRPVPEIVGSPALDPPLRAADDLEADSGGAIPTDGLLDVLEVRLDCGDGHGRDFILRQAPYQGGHEPAEGLVGVLTDITERKRMEEELRRTSQRDALTGLANRRTFEERLQTEWSRAARVSRPLSLVMVDIDHFKEFNDLHGHLEGDECLRRVAEVIEATFRRSGELTARWGGEEFAVVLAEVDRRDAIALAERLRRAVEDAAIPRRGRSSRVTVSVGVASLLPTPSSHPLHLVSLADEAMYRSKRQGRNRVTVSSEAAVF